MPKEYLDFTARARDYVQYKRTSKMEFYSPRHYVIHHFVPASSATQPVKKVLITHGWRSRAAYMVRTIRILQQQGYEVFALDFPAHGEARGLQLPWLDAVMILRDILNNLGPFYAVIGHSFGGSMLLNTLNIGRLIPGWQIQHPPKRVVLIASPTRMRTPVCHLARRVKLSAKGFSRLCESIQKHSVIDLHQLNLQNFVRNIEIPVLCIHGQQDTIIDVKESILFCRKYPHASLALIPDADHIGVLIDRRVEKMVSNFLL